jgi:hypothetical protein
LGVDDNKDFVPRPIHLADVLVVVAGFFNNIAQSFVVLTEEFLELTVYNANRETKVKKVWEDFANDLEKIEEDQDGS